MKSYYQKVFGMNDEQYEQFCDCFEDMPYEIWRSIDNIMFDYLSQKYPELVELVDDNGDSELNGFLDEHLVIKFDTQRMPDDGRLIAHTMSRFIFV